MIDVENLTKRFGDLVAVDGVSFSARPGTITGLLGPNGAGKSTTLGCISGLVEPSSRFVRVLGHDVREDGREITQQALDELAQVPRPLDVSVAGQRRVIPSGHEHALHELMFFGSGPSGALPALGMLAASSLVLSALAAKYFRYQ